MRYFAFSDIHGQGKHFDKIMKFLDQQEGEIKCIFLGDACDRGPDGYEIMWKLLNDERVIYLKGNHEDMFVKACWEFIEHAEEEGCSPTELARRLDWDIRNIGYSEAINLCLWNGGQPTLNAWLRASCPLRLLRRLEQLPLQATVLISDAKGWPVRYIDMCHAGCIEDEWEDSDKHALLWDRTHFSAKWDPADNIPHMLIHGHTPTEHLSQYAWDASHKECMSHKPVMYSDGTKMDIDTGVFYTGAISVVELDTLNITTFREDD